MRTASDDFKKMLEGYGLATLYVVYHRLDYPSLVQTLTYQQYDLYPEFPYMTNVVKRMRAETCVRTAVIGHSRLIKPAEFRSVETEFRLH